MPEFPFQPLSDSVLGAAILRALNEKGISEEEILDCMPQRLGFTCTPNVKKQIILSTLPDKMRKWIEKKEWSNIQNEFQSISFEEGQLDVVLELLEWILTGFEPEVFLEVVPGVFPLKIWKDKEIFPSVESHYHSLMQEESE